MRVLIVEDDKVLASSISQILKDHQILNDQVHEGDEALEYIRTEAYDVIILDVMLPEMNGLEILQRMRSMNINTPVIFLTAKDTIQDKVKGLNLGADDYLTKPFEALELIARVKALSRRKNEILHEEIVFGNLTLNTNTRQLFTHTSQIQLGAKEYEIIKLLLSHPETTFSKETIFNKVWGIDSEATETTIETYVSFLRKKLSYLKSNVKITTLRKVGYKVELSDD